MNFQSAPINSFIVFMIDVVGMTLIASVLLSKAKAILKVIFALMIVMMFVWINLAFFARIARNEHDSLTFIRIAWSFTPTLFVLLHSFMVNLMGTAHKRKLVIFLLYILASMFLYITLFTDFVIANIEFIDGILNIRYGKFVWFFFGWVALLTFYNVFVLVRNYRRKDINVEQQRQIKILLLGLGIFFTANAIFNIILPVFYNIFDQYVFGDYSLIVFMSIIAYATVKQQFFGSRVIGATFLTIFLGSFLFVDALIFSTTLQLRIIKLGFFTAYVPFGTMLVNSVYSEIKRKEELFLLNKKLTDLDSQKNEFLNVASHELRAPMTAIKGYLSMIEHGDAGELPSSATEYLGEAIGETERMIRLVNNMLDVARIEEGRMVFEEGLVSLSKVVEHVFSELSFEAEEKKLGYAYHPKAPLQDIVKVDVDRIHEAVVNLINNAIKYTDSGKIVVRLLNPSPKIIRFEVEDTGPGMTPDEVSKLFNKFYRTESYVGKKMGTGLGLYITKLLVEKFGGKIGVHSKKGKGSLFWFELPVNK